ncbi:MAG: transglycosylase domain-containing protein [Erysipelotrichaceae bacterium]|nr:transglycosylase domain-containing protein [Erysipelotrichaceae bacterium]MCI9313060.1 transglycosylase domain-containing protein [Erysipelotrichaceae bacterium]
MRLWKKAMIVITALLIGIVGMFAWLGYCQYREVVTQMPLEQKIAAIKSSESYVTYDELSPALVQATIAVEDHRFYDHHGFDVWATSRALVNNLLGNGRTSGGSTITQQLAKNLYFGYEPSFIRKIAELYVVYDLEHNYSKEEILTLYVNIINYGDQHIGIAKATQGYFGVEPDALTLAQASLLAGLPQSPANYQLSDHYEQAKVRQAQVLEAMVRRRMITDTERTAVLNAMP